VVCVCVCGGGGGGGESGEVRRARVGCVSSCVGGVRQLPRPVFLRRLGDLNPAQMQKIAHTIKLWLGIA